MPLEAKFAIPVETEAAEAARHSNDPVLAAQAIRASAWETVKTLTNQQVHDLAEAQRITLRARQEYLQAVSESHQLTISILKG